MPVFGITGNLASGKSEVAKLLKNKGAVVFDADALVHQYYQDKKSLVYKKVAASFPEAAEKGQISRKKLGNIVFSCESKLRKLERIVHPPVIRELKKWTQIQKKKREIAIAEVPLLFEKRLEKHFDRVILVCTKRQTLEGRIQKKYGLSPDQIKKRLSLYLPVREKIKKSEFFVNNNKNMVALKKEVNSLWKELLAFRANKYRGSVK